MLQFYDLSTNFTNLSLQIGNAQNVYSTFIEAPDPPLFSCPYQEDLISSIQFLRDDRTQRKGNIENLIDHMRLSPRKVTKRKNKDDIRLEPVPHTSDVSENQLTDLHSVGDNETNRTNSEAITVQRHVKKKLIPIHNTPQSTNEQNMPETFRHLFEVDRKSLKLPVEQTNGDQKAESKANFQNESPENLLANTEQIYNIYKQENSNALKDNKPAFNIPYQRVSDILDESTFVIPESMYCDNSNWKSDTPVKQQIINPTDAMKSAITCSESDETVAMLFKPKTISLMQVCDNLLKKITVTVLVPYHVSKIGI